MGHPAEPEAEYVIEVLDVHKPSFSLRRTDMDNPKAVTAFLHLFSLMAEAQIRPQDIEQIVTQIPPEWRYFSVTLTRDDDKYSLAVGHVEREPGVNTKNPVVNTLDITSLH